MSHPALFPISKASLRAGENPTQGALFASPGSSVHTKNSVRAGFANPVKFFRSLIVFACIGTSSNADMVFLEQTELFDLSLGTSGSSLIGNFSSVVVPLSDGSEQSLSKFYKANYPDVNILLGTDLGGGTVFTWGFSTGSSGEKFKVDPSVTLGLIHVEQLTRYSTLTLFGSQKFFGGVKEKACTANFGAIGGVQKVNCRLAATILEPSKTLDFLVDEPRLPETRVGFKFTINF